MHEHERPLPYDSGGARRAPASPLVLVLYCNHMIGSRSLLQNTDTPGGGAGAEETSSRQVFHRGRSVRGERRVRKQEPNSSKKELFETLETAGQRGDQL